MIVRARARVRMCLCVCVVTICPLSRWPGHRKHFPSMFGELSQHSAFLTRFGADVPSSSLRTFEKDTTFCGVSSKADPS